MLSKKRSSLAATLHNIFSGDDVDEEESVVFRSLSSYSSLPVFRSISNFRGQSTLLSWIFGVARNLSNNSLRRFQGQREKFESVSPDHFAPNSSIGNAAPDDELNMRRYVDAIRSEMEELPTWQRRIFEMRHLENMSISEISAQTQRSSDAVRSSLYRMKRMIFEAVDFSAEASLR